MTELLSCKRCTCQEMSDVWSDMATPMLDWAHMNELSARECQMVCVWGFHHIVRRMNHYDGYVSEEA